MNETPKNKSGWRILRRLLVAMAILATLTAAFYAEEDWRGKRAWENCKRELEAKGAVLDWNAYIPPPVPDDQNFFTYSTNIMLRFHKSQTEAQSEAATALQWLQLTVSGSNSFPLLDFGKSNQLVVADLLVMTPETITGTSRKINSSIRLNDPAAGEKIQTLIRATVGRSGVGAASFHFSELPLEKIEPARIVLEADSPPSLNDFQNLIPPDLASNIGRLAVEVTVDPQVFQVKFVSGKITAAADYLQWSDQFVPAFDDIREALKRPWAMLPGDYSVPYELPIPNFVTLRSLAQTLAQRTQCYLLLNEPDKALRELTLMHDVCRILERPLTGKPMTLVEAMINVAITGVYVATVQEGFRLHEWQEPQLVAIQSQLAGVNLPPHVLSAFDCEQGATCRFAEISKMSKLLNLAVIVSPNKKRTLWDKIRTLPSHAIDLAPRGWMYQNMAVFARLIQLARENLIDENQNVAPKRVDQASKQFFQALENNHSPFYLLARIATPNFSKAMLTCTYNQNLSNEAQIVCALERYRLAHGEYPETLDALMPQFIEKLPHDIIGGQPLHYRRTEDGKFLLYSVGWNETDDGGVPGTLADVKKGDWVWQYPGK